MQKKAILIINAIISVILVAAILHFVGFDEVLQEFAGVDLGFLLMSIVFLFLMDIVMAYRIQILLREAGTRLAFLNVLKSHFVGMFLADFTPSRTGYFATVAALRFNYSVPSDKALLSIFGPQIYDFVFKVLAGSIAILYILFVFIGPEQGWILILSALVISAIILVMVLVLFSNRFLKLFSFAERLPLISNLYGVVMKMQGNSHVVLKKTPHIIALIVISWSFRSLSWYCVAKSVGITVDTPFPEVFFYFFLQPLLTMLEFVPSPTIAGLGLSEGGATLVFSLFSIVPAKAASFALLARVKSTFLHIFAVPELLKVPQALKL